MKIIILLALCGLALAQERQRLYGNPDGVLFPGPVKSSSRKSSNVGLSIKQARAISEIDTMEEFLEMIGGVSKETGEVIIGSRFGNVERSNAIIPTPAKCEPELQVVSLMNERPDSSVVYFPSCTRIKRCGGCCEHMLLACEPTASITKNFQVLVSRINDEGDLAFSEKAIVPLEEHTRCKCDCRIKEEHCTAKQKYIKDECVCACPNIDEEEKCRQSSETKLWDPNLCACRCREEKLCNTGFYYNPVTCRCEQLAFRRRFGVNQKSGHTTRDSSRSQDISPYTPPIDPFDPRRKNKEDPEYK